MGMAFLNLALVLGVAAFNIPVIIHLLNRSRFKVVRWGAMHLLEEIVRKNRRRIRLEEIILLLVRAAIPVALALCLARPVLTGLGLLAGRSPSSMVVLLDNSYSMEAGTPRTNYHLAREAAGGIVRDLPRGSEVHCLTMGGHPAGLTDAASTDLERLAERLAGSQAGCGAAAVARSLEAALDAFKAMRGHAKRDLVIVSDFQAGDWSEQDAPMRARLSQALGALEFKPSIVLLRAGDGKPFDNLCVESIELSRLAVGLGQTVRIKATLRNFGRTPWPGLRVYLRVDGQGKVERSVAVEAGARAQVEFEHRFEEAGSHVVEVAADADSLAADNALAASVLVWDRLPVLLVNGDPSREGMRSETDYLELALQPYASVRAGLADLIQTTIIKPEELSGTRLAEHRVVVLANVRQLPEFQVRELEAFVRDGGGLVVFPGDKVDAGWYNARLFADGAGLLPAGLGSLQGSLTDPEKQTAIVAGRHEHPALAYFNDPQNGNLADGRVWLWHHLNVPAQAGGAAGARTIAARLQTGQPLLVEQGFGQGLVLQFCTAADGDWSNWAVRPFFLPLMQQVMVHAASRVYPPRNVEVGQPLVSFLPGDQARKLAVVTDPEGRRHDVPILPHGARAVAQFADTNRPGLYLMETPDRRKIHFVAATSRQESDIRTLSEDELAKVAQGLGAQVAGGWEEYRRLDRERRFGREVWTWLFAVAAILLFSELFLQQVFGRARG